MASIDEIAAHLATPRDFLRYAVSRFESAGLAYGHGVTNAFDEAAFMVLEGLSLPIDRLEPFLDARLLPAERQRLAELIEARATTRKPAAYLLGKSYIQGVPFLIDERAIVPRSFIGELLFTDLFGVDGPARLMEGETIARALDLCTGSAALAILAAKLFEQAQVDAVDLSADALAVARRNVALHELESRVRLLHGDLFAPLGDARYDLILTNPPYVDAPAMAALPAEYRHEPVMALAGGVDGLDIVRKILDAAPAHLNPGGGILCEIGTGRAALEAHRPDLPFLWLDTEESAGEVFWLRTEDFRPTRKGAGRKG